MKRALLVLAVACQDRKAAPPPVIAPEAAVSVAADPDAAIAIDALTADAIAFVPFVVAKGSVDEPIATWWNEAATGDPATHAAAQFVVEVIADRAIFGTETCGMPFVVDQPSPKDECLRLAIVNHRPPAKLRDGWSCAGFSSTDLAKRIKSEREAAKDRLRCGDRRGAHVFVALDNSGKVTAFLVHTDASP
jgi:hypothetical protein